MTSGRLSKYIMAIREHAVIDGWDKANNVMAPVSTLEYPQFLAITATSFAASTNYTVLTPPNDAKTWQIIGVSYRFHVQATSAASFIVEVAGAGIAPASGTAQSGNLTLQGTADTTINGTLTAQTIFGAGSAINLLVNSTATTGLANFSLTLMLQRVT